MPARSDFSVLSGRFKGIPLQSPHSSLTHPMGSREKIALFNMLQSYLEGAVVLDIYAGSGALGIEALSRGARQVFFVEKSAQISKIIRQNLTTIAEKGHLEAISATLPPIGGGTAVVNSEAKNAIFYNVFIASARDFAQNPAAVGVFDVILADPPYDGFDVAELAELPKLLRTDGILALSYPFAQGTPEFNNLELLTARKYAAAGIALYRKNISR